LAGLTRPATVAGIVRTRIAGGPASLIASILFAIRINTGVLLVTGALLATRVFARIRTRLFARIRTGLFARILTSIGTCCLTCVLFALRLAGKASLFAGEIASIVASESVAPCSTSAAGNAFTLCLTGETSIFTGKVRALRLTGMARVTLTLCLDFTLCWTRQARIACFFSALCRSRVTAELPAWAQGNCVGRGKARPFMRADTNTPV
jgi:hypothetical protein